MRRGLISLLAACWPPLAAAQETVPPAIDSLALKAHTWLLSHDMLAGRGTGTRGADVAALYLAAAAEQLGLRGAGPGGSYFQPVPVVEAWIDTAATAMTISDSSGSVTLRSPRAFIPNVGTLATLVDFAGEIVWVGTAAGVREQPGRLPPLQGRVAVMAGVFGADGAAADTLRARGAAGVIHFVGNDEVYQLYARSRGASRMSAADPATRSSFIPAIPSVLARAEVIRRLLPPDTDEDDLEQPFVAEGHRVSVNIRVRTSEVPARNVAAWLEGSDPRLRSEYVVYSAHYDHLGIGEPDARGDSIHNGFSDNAAGCAMLLAIARWFEEHRPARSVLLVWFTGEEHGLLGSDYFAAHPLVAPRRIAGVINLDAGAPPAPPPLWRISGGDRSSLGTIAIEVARAAGWEAQTAPASPNTDYYPFLRIGVPAVFLVPGPGPFEGLTTDSSDALRRRWDHYHQASDEWSDEYPFSGLVRYAEFALRLGIRIAAGPLPARAAALP